MAYTDASYRDNSPDEIKQIREDIYKTFQENLNVTPFIQAETRKEYHKLYNDYYKQPKTILVVTLEMDITDSTLTWRLDGGG